MVRRRKSYKIETYRTFNNAFEADSADRLKGKWAEEIFGNSNPIVLELGCGKGDYTVELARKFPQKNFIGIDSKGARLYTGAKAAEEEQLPNAAFLRTLIERIPDFFGAGEISEIWITFPDPYPRESKAKKRLTSTRFLNLYREIVKPLAVIHLKTDNEGLFEYSLEVIKEEGHQLLGYTFDLYNSNMLNELTAIKTTYEAKFLAQGMDIKYLHFRLKD